MNHLENPNNNSTNKNNNNNNSKKPSPNKRKGLTALIYILVPIIIVIGIMYATKSTKEVETQYYQVVNYFDTGKVEEFSLNLGSRVLDFKLKDEKTPRKYTVPNVSVFLEDVNEVVREHNKNAASEE